MNNDMQIEELLQDFEMVNAELGGIMRSLREMVLVIAPDSDEKVMYGGIIYAIPGRMFCGLFLRKRHISVEFDLGCLLEDRFGYLEGNGRYRRHLKIHNSDEVKSKMVETFVRDSYELKT